MDETILFADLAGFTALTEPHGDEPAVAVATRFTALAEATAGDRAVLVKTIGDAVMMSGAVQGSALGVALDLLDAVRNAGTAPATLPYDGRAWHFCSFECARRFATHPDRFVA